MRAAGTVVVLSAAVALFAGPVSSGGPPAMSPPPSRVEVGDAETPRARREVHDVVGAVFEAKEGMLEATVRFKRPLIEGTFECLHLYVDCDADPATGIEGAEVWARSSIGSRFQRTSAPSPAEGVPAPATLLRSSWSSPYTEGTRSGPSGVQRWINRASLEVSEPGPDTLTVRLPLAVVVQQGLQYNRFVRVRLEVEGSCSQHPLSLAYSCADEGVSIRVDGRDDDWSGQPHVDRTPGSMHTDTTEVEIISMSVEHDATNVYALLRLATDGFSRRETDDVADEDEITVGLEPLAGANAYMTYQELTVSPAKTSSTRPGAPAFALGTRLVEVSLPRRPEQTAFRVLAWSDARRRDYVPNGGWIEVGVPPEAFKTR